MTGAPHIPVMLDEVLHALEPRDGGLYIDGTFGAGGYSRAILSAADCRLIGIDRDPSVRPAAEHLKQAAPGRFVFVEAPFSAMEEVVRTVLLDLAGGTGPVREVPSLGREPVRAGGML